MQNKILQTRALSVVRGIATSFREVKYFAIKVDEVTDASYREQVVPCFRWVNHELEAHEDFVGLHKVDKINSNTLVAVIKMSSSASICTCTIVKANAMTEQPTWPDPGVGQQRKFVRSRNVLYLHTAMATH